MLASVIPQIKVWVGSSEDTNRTDIPEESEPESTSESTSPFVDITDYYHVLSTTMPNVIKKYKAAAVTAEPGWFNLEESTQKVSLLIL